MGICPSSINRSAAVEGTESVERPAYQSPIHVSAKIIPTYVVTFANMGTAPPPPNIDVPPPPHTAKSTAGQPTTSAGLHQNNQNEYRTNYHMNNQKKNFHITLYIAAFTIAAKSSATSEAPPINPPSILSCSNNSVALSGFTDPPYCMRTACATSSS